MARRISAAATDLTAIVRTAEIVAGAVDVLEAADGIVDAAVAVDAAADGIADAAGRAGDGTNFFATDLHGFTRI